MACRRDAGATDLNWGTAEALFGDLDPGFDLNAFLPASVPLATGDGDYSILATLEFVREAQVDDAAGSQVVIGEDTATISSSARRETIS